MNRTIRLSTYLSGEISASLIEDSILVGWLDYKPGSETISASVQRTFINTRFREAEIDEDDCVSKGSTKWALDLFWERLRKFTGGTYL